MADKEQGKLHPDAIYGNRDGGNRQVLFLENKELADKKFDSWPFRIFSSTCVLAQQDPLYTDEVVTQQTWKLLIEGFNFESGKGNLLSSALLFFNYFQRLGQHLV